MWVEIFKSGKHTDSNGRSFDYTAEDIAEIADIYNSQILTDPSRKAPVVKGHPADNEPAYGWVERLARRGSSLIADLKDIHPELIDEVRKGMFRKVSISLFPDKLLRHVGVLGAGIPAVKGLDDLKFSEDENISCFIHEFSENNGVSSYREIMDENEKLRSELELIRKESRIREFREYTNKLITSGDNPSITPAQSDIIIDLLEMAYEKDKSMNLDYTDTTSSVSRVRNFIESLQPVISFSEFAVTKPDTAVERRNKFTGSNTSPERLRIHELAVELQEHQPGLSYEEAVIRVTK